MNGFSSSLIDGRSDTHIINMVGESLDVRGYSQLESLLSPEGRPPSGIPINFAWYNSEYQDNCVEIASDLIAKSDKIVIIGYSFPYFNRRVDSGIFNKLITLDESQLRKKKIYMQIPENHITRVKFQLKLIDEKLYDIVEDVPYVDEFLIP